MGRANHLLVVTLVLLIALTVVPLKGFGADDSSTSDPPKKAKSSTPTYTRLLDELARERARVDELEKEVKALETSNTQLQQTTAGLQTTTEQFAKTEKQVTDIQKTIYSQLGPFSFGDRLNSFLGQHTFTMVGGVSAGYYFDRKSAMSQPALDFDVNPMIRINDWIQFYASLGATVEPGDGISSLGPSLANLQIFPLGQEEPLELVAGLFDIPFGDWYENQSPNWVNPFVTAPLLYGAEAVAPPSSLGLQARGGIQWGQTGQDVDYTVWADSGPSFESAPGVSSIPAPIIGEALNPLTGTNLATNGRAFGGRFRLFPLPLDQEIGRLELMASTYDGKWMNGFWYNSWDVGYAYRVGPFRTRGEWAQTYRQMPGPGEIGHIPGFPVAPSYPGCCGHENRQGWYVMAGYFLYGIPHPYLGDWLEPRFNKTEFLVRYSGVNQRAILANDISTIPVFGFNGSPSVFSPHAREVALAVDYWIAPNIVWQNEVDFELPQRGGTLYNFPGGAFPPTASAINATTNDVAVETQLAIGF